MKKTAVTTGCWTALRVISREGSVDELRSVYAAASCADVNYQLSRNEAADSEDFETFMLGASIAHLLTCEVRFNHVDRALAGEYVAALRDMGLNLAQTNESGQTAKDLDVFWKCGFAESLGA